MDKRRKDEALSIGQLEKAIDDLEENKTSIDPIDRIKIRLNIAKIYSDIIKKEGPKSDEVETISVKAIEKNNKKRRSKLGV